MRGIYDGPTTGRHSLLSRPTWARASKSLDLPQAPRTAEAAAHAGLGGPGENIPQGDAHEQLRQATVTPPISIPGGLGPDGTVGRNKPLKPNVASFLRLVSPDSQRAYRPHVGVASLPTSPASSVGSGGLSPEAEQELLAGSLKGI